MELLESSNRQSQIENKGNAVIKVDLNAAYQKVHQANADRSLAEVVQIDTTLGEQSLDKTGAVNFSPTFKPDQLSFKSADMPL